MKLSEYAEKIQQAMRLKKSLELDLVGGTIKFVLHNEDVATAKATIKQAIDSAATGEPLLVSHEQSDSKSISMSPEAFNHLTIELSLTFLAHDIMRAYYHQLQNKALKFDKLVKAPGVDLSAQNHHPDLWLQAYNNHTMDKPFLRQLVQAQSLHYMFSDKEVVQHTKCAEHYSDIPGTPSKRNLGTNFVIQVVAVDCLDAAAKIVSSGKRVLVLNMANQYSPGGGYKKGSGAQEEDLFRRTTLVRSLDEKFYPKRQGIGEFGVLYSDSVRVFRRGGNAGYAFLPKELQFDISVVSSAAYNLKQSKIKVNSGQYNAGMKHKIRNQLRTAVKHGHRNLVLSAFGCGSFQNDPATVAGFYQNVLSESEFADSFDLVQFAIVPNPLQRNNANFDVFNRILTTEPGRVAYKRAVPTSLLADEVSEEQPALFRCNAQVSKTTPPRHRPTAPSLPPLLPEVDEAALDAAFAKYSTGQFDIDDIGATLDYLPLVKNLLGILKQTQQQHAQVCKRFSARFFPRHHHGKEGIKRVEKLYREVEQYHNVDGVCKLIDEHLKQGAGNLNPSSFKTLLMKNFYQRFKYHEIKDHNEQSFGAKLAAVAKHDFQQKGLPENTPMASTAA